MDEQGQSRAPHVLALLASWMLSAACASQEPWTLAVSRSVYESDGMQRLAGNFGDEPNPAGACAVVALLALPIAFDVVALPITLPHDLFVHSGPW